MAGDGAPAMSPATLFIGQSHVGAIRLAAKARREADPDRPRTRVIHTLEPHYAPELAGEGDQAVFTPALGDAIRDQIDRHAPLVASVSGGNVHNSFALIRHPRPFDFMLSEEDGPSLDPDAEPLSEALVRAALADALKRDYVRLAEIRRIAGAFVQFESPPPLADNGLIADQADAYFKDRAIAHLGVAPPRLRYKMWRLHSRIVADRCAALGVQFLPVPRDCRDDSGFLLPHLAGDATHGNAAYGEAMIRALEAL